MSNNSIVSVDDGIMNNNNLNDLNTSNTNHLNNTSNPRYSSTSTSIPPSHHHTNSTVSVPELVANRLNSLANQNNNNINEENQVSSQIQQLKINEEHERI